MFAVIIQAWEEMDLQIIIGLNLNIMIYLQQETVKEVNKVRTNNPLLIIVYK
jgi:hypothetical protein